MSGLKLAAIYGIRPHLLGFCGPQGESLNKALFNFISGKKISEKKIRKIFKKFEAAFCYYKLIARYNKIRDPFSQKVVSAYWIGNRLLEKVPVTALRQMVKREFSRPGLLLPKIAESKANAIPSGALAHHSFHVLFIGSITGRVKLQGKLFDLCRIGWGKITKIEPKKGKIRVKYQPLISCKGKYILGGLTEKDIIWNKNFLPKANVGQIISFHWSQAVQALNIDEVKNLNKYTRKTLATISPTL